MFLMPTKFQIHGGNGFGDKRGSGQPLTFGKRCEYQKAW